MMSIFETLRASREFLERRMLPETPGHLRSELRAVIKILADIDGEIDALPALLVADCAALLDLAEAAEALLPAQLAGKLSTRLWRRDIEGPPGSLKDLVALHDEIRAEAGQILLSLQASTDLRCERLARQYIALVARQADARLPWQSVFI